MSFDIIRLETLRDTSRPFRRRKIVGRGPGSKRGKTCGRGIKGMGSRSGYKIRAGKEGGGVPLFRRIPVRGFTRGRFLKKPDVINLDMIDTLFKDHEVVSLESLTEKGFIRGPSHGIKVLSKGSITKKVTFDGVTFSQAAKEKLSQAGINV